MTDSCGCVADGVLWSGWTELVVHPSFSPEGLRETLDGGQMFRFNRGSDGVWMGVWGRNVVHIRVSADGSLEVSFPSGQEREGLSAVRRLLGLDLPYGDYYGALLADGDVVMQAAVAACGGLRIVNLPLSEAVLCFLCSPMKRIHQIKQVLERLASAFGEALFPGVMALPSWECLAGVGEPALRACGLGFRAKSIAGTARFLSEHPGFLDDVAALSYGDARKKLTLLPGVGGKIADCALLYSGTSALEPFPVDTWILRAMTSLYGLENLPPERVAIFGREKFGSLAGLAQQFLFVYARRHLGS